MASATTRLSKPWQVDWTITQCRMPSMACNAKSFSLGASAGVNGRLSAKGKILCGPNTCTCASQAPEGGLSFGRLGAGWKDGCGSVIDGYSSLKPIALMMVLHLACSSERN